MLVCARGAEVVDVNEIDARLAVLTISFLVPLSDVWRGINHRYLLLIANLPAVTTIFRYELCMFVATDLPVVIVRFCADEG